MESPANQNGYEWIVFVAAIVLAVGLLALGHFWKSGGNLQMLPAVILHETPSFTELAPHRATYEIGLKTLRSSGQFVNISGTMTFEWNRSCDASTSAHIFNMRYEYADAPAIQVQSNFSNYETADGRFLDFNMRRLRGNTPYETIRGQADRKAGVINYTQPQESSTTLSPEILFPTAHTLGILKAIRENKKLYNVVMFDGSDKNGPIEVSAFIGRQSAPYVAAVADENSDNKEDTKVKIDTSLLEGPAHNLRLAFFPSGHEGQYADYEMSLVFHENGVMRDILIEYDDFSITQKLITLETLESQCQGGKQK